MTIATTPAQISAVRLLSLKGMLTLESKGLKTRGGSLRSRLAAEFGLAPRASYDKYLAKINELLQS